MPIRVFFQDEYTFSIPGKHILFQQKSKLVPFHIVSHSKLYNNKNVLCDIKIKVKQVHGAECKFVFWLCFLSFVHFQ